MQLTSILAASALISTVFSLPSPNHITKRTHEIIDDDSSFDEQPDLCGEFGIPELCNIEVPPTFTTEFPISTTSSEDFLFPDPTPTEDDDVATLTTDWFSKPTSDTEEGNEDTGENTEEDATEDNEEDESSEDITTSTRTSTSTSTITASTTALSLATPPIITRTHTLPPQNTTTKTNTAPTLTTLTFITPTPLTTTLTLLLPSTLTLTTPTYDSLGFYVSDTTLTTTTSITSVSVSTGMGKATRVVTASRAVPTMGGRNETTMEGGRKGNGTHVITLVESTSSVEDGVVADSKAGRVNLGWGVVWGVVVVMVAGLL